MAHAEGSVTIDRPVTTVFNFIADGSIYPLWRSSVTDIQRVPHKPQGLGAVFKQGLKGQGGRIDGDYEIVEYQPNKLIKFQIIAGSAKPTGTYTFEALGDSARLTFTLHFEPKVTCPPETDPTFELGSEQGDRSKCPRNVSPRSRSSANCEEPKCCSRKRRPQWRSAAP